MYICICKAVSDRHIRQAAEEGINTIKQLRLATQAGSCCGKCLPEAKRCLDEALNQRQGSSTDVIELQDVA